MNTVNVYWKNYMVSKKGKQFENSIRKAVKKMIKENKNKKEGK